VSPAQWDHFFSMVSSGLRARVWADLGGFREDLQYAEDDDYTRRCKALGWAVRYVPDSVVMHSHNYTAEQARKRAFGDAKAIGQAWSKPTHSFGWPRTVLLGTLSDLRHDLRFCLRHRRLLRAASCRTDPRSTAAGALAGLSCGLRCEGRRAKGEEPEVLSAQRSVCKPDTSHRALSTLFPWLLALSTITHENPDPNQPVSTPLRRWLRIALRGHCGSAARPGHSVEVLTSNHGVGNSSQPSPPEPAVERSLRVHGFLGIHGWTSCI